MTTAIEPRNGSHPTPPEPVAPGSSTTTPSVGGPSITAPALGVIGAAVALLAGGWLMYAPFVLGHQPEGAEWADATVTDFWTGLGLAVLALVGLAVLTAGLVAALRARGVLTARPQPPAVEPPAAAAAGDELTALLRPLVEALTRDTAGTATPAAGATANHHRVVDPAER